MSRTSVFAETIQCLVVLPPWYDDDEIVTTAEYFDLNGDLSPVTTLNGYIPLSSITCDTLTVLRVGVDSRDFTQVVQRWTVSITDESVTFDGPHPN